jgi:hypothetical protein
VRPKRLGRVTAGREGLLLGANRALQEHRSADGGASLQIPHQIPKVIEPERDMKNQELSNGAGTEASNVTRRENIGHLVLSEHASSDVSGKPRRQLVFARNRLLSQVAVQIGVDLRELGAQDDLHREAYVEGWQTSTGLKVRDGATTAEAQEQRELLLAQVPQTAESKQIITKTNTGVLRHTLIPPSSQIVPK